LSTNQGMEPSQRRARMAAIKKKNTKPELLVRKLLWSRGLRYRLHVGTLPGCPDVVMKSRSLVIFIHGCLWHLHEGCKLVRIPKSRPDYWPAKLARNKARDELHVAKLHAEGWTVEVIWECETRDPDKLGQRLDQIWSAPRATIAYPLPVPGCAG